MKKHFNKNLIMIEEEEQFQSSNTCWICGKLIDDENVRDHSHVTAKFRSAAHLQLTKKVPVIFHNIRGYDSHSIFCVLTKFNVKTDVVPYILKKYMAFS